MKILIPSCKPNHETVALVETIAAVTPGAHFVLSSLPASASVNRNSCLSHVHCDEIAIMLDDDIEGFYRGWVDDLVAPLADPSVLMVSARLLNPDGSIGPTCSRCYDMTPDTIEIYSNGVAILPTAAIAFRHLGICFDCAYVGSGFEDSDWCHQILREHPDGKFLQSNKCRLIHRNEMKNQHGPNWKHNQMYFWNKWHGQRSPMRVTV